MQHRNRLLLVLPALVLAVAAAARADVMKLPMPGQYVADYASIIDTASKQKLLGLLQELEQKTGAQVIVLTLPDLEGYAIEGLSIHLAHNRWKLGQKGKDNGVLITVAPKERKYRIEVGYGLEGILPDGLVGRIGRTDFVPNFKNGDYGTGIYQATARVAGIIAADAGVTLTGMPDLPQLQRSSGLARGLAGLLPLIIIFILLARGGPLGWILFGWGASAAFRGWGGSSGGGFGGGGFGSFGGGGGGGFGGGGASGSW